MSEQDQPRPAVRPTEQTPQASRPATASDDEPSQTNTPADDGRAVREPISFDWTLVVAIAVGFAVSAGAHWSLLPTVALAIGVYALCVAGRWTYRRVRRAR